MNPSVKTFDTIVRDKMPTRVRRLFMMIDYYMRSSNFKHLKDDPLDAQLKNLLKDKQKVYKHHCEDLLYANSYYAPNTLETNHLLNETVKRINEYYSDQEFNEINDIYKTLVESK